MGNTFTLNTVPYNFDDPIFLYNNIMFKFVLFLPIIEGEIELVDIFKVFINSNKFKIV